MGRLADRDLVDPIADAGDDDAEQLGEPRIDARAEERRAAPLARVDQSLAIRAEPPAVDERRGVTTLTPASRIRTSSSIEGHMGL